MKTLAVMIRYCYYLMVFALLAGCSEDEPSLVKVQFGEEFQIAEDQRALLTLQEGERIDSLVVKLDSVLDQRCAEGAKCFYFGYAEIDFTLSKGSDRKTFNMCIGDCYLRGGNAPSENNDYTDTLKVSYGNHEYQVLFLNVVPYPKVNEKVKYPRAVMKVNPL